MNFPNQRIPSAAPDATSARPSEEPDSGPAGGRPDTVVAGDPEIRALLEQVRAGALAAAAVDLKGARLFGLDLTGLDLSGADLEGADLSRVDLTGTRFFGTRLAGASLYQVKAEGTEFAGADLTGANLVEADLTRAGFGRSILVDADLTGATLTAASFNGADLSGAALHSADLTDTCLREANLTNADLGRARLVGTDLESATVTRARFDNADLERSTLSRTIGFRTASWLAVNLRDIDFSGAYLLRDFIEDQNFLEEFRRQSTVHEWTYRLWWLTSDCGRSAFRWGACGGFIAILFAAIYTQVGVDFGSHPTLLSPLYFSVVTFTTLGYGDVLPTTMAAQVTVMAEVIAGYVMLGGLLSLITTKLARRAG